MINRGLYKNWVTKEGMSKWQCPTCNSSSLQVIEDKFIQQHNSETETNYNEDWFQAPEMITYTFTTLLSCANKDCREVITCSGTGSVEREQYTYDDYKYVEYYKPFFFYPPLQIFKIPVKTPDDVKKSILSSFSLVFDNKSAAANQVRTSIECLLTHLKIKKNNISGGKRKKLNLHRRIELLPIKYQKIKDICLAIKWLGNAGSHCDDEMSFDDVFDGYDMLSFILEELYDNKHIQVTKLAKRINAKKGI